MTTDLKFVRFNETNDHEGETWTFWLQVDGNEAELDKLANLICDLDDAAEEHEEPEFYLADHREETLSEEHVDVLVKHAGGTTYMAAHTKVVGTFTCPDELGDGGRVLYKGQIRKLFTAEVPSV